MTARAFAVAIGLAAASTMSLVACGAGDLGDSADDNGGADASTCSTGIRFEPDMVVAGVGTMVRANGDVTGVSGFLTYTWIVEHDGAAIPVTSAAQEGRDVFFEVATPGVYRVALFVDGCPLTAYADLTATAAGALDTAYRLRVEPPVAANLPVREQVIIVQGGGDAAVGNIGLPAGASIPGAVTAAGNPVAAYLRFAPLSQPALLTEAFTSAAGEFTLRLASEPHQLLVVPASPALAPNALFMRTQSRLYRISAR